MQCGASFGCYKTCVRSHRSGRCCVKQKRFDLNDIIMWRKKAGEKKKQKQHSSQQKQHNRKSTQHIICIYPSVAISAHCWCSNPASVFAPCRFPLQFVALSSSACYTYRCQWRWCSAMVAGRRKLAMASRIANVCYPTGHSGPAFPGH